VPVVGHEAVRQKPQQRRIQGMGHHPLERGIVLLFLKNLPATPRLRT
jgi:hypothetical protein